MIKEVKYYVLGIVDVILLQLHNLEFLDETLKTASLVVGLIVGILTAIKFYFDLIRGKKEDRLKDLELQKKQEEVRRFFEDKYKS